MCRFTSEALIRRVDPLKEKKIEGIMGLDRLGISCYKSLHLNVTVAVTRCYSVTNPSGRSENIGDGLAVI